MYIHSSSCLFTELLCHWWHGCVCGPCTVAASASSLCGIHQWSGPLGGRKGEESCPPQPLHHWAARGPLMPQGSRNGPGCCCLCTSGREDKKETQSNLSVHLLSLLQYPHSLVWYNSTPPSVLQEAAWKATVQQHNKSGRHCYHSQCRGLIQAKQWDQPGGSHGTVCQHSGVSGRHSAREEKE